MENARHARRAFPESGLKANLEFYQVRGLHKSRCLGPTLEGSFSRPEGPRVSSHARKGVVTGKSLPRPKGPTLTSHFLSALRASDIKLVDHPRPNGRGY